MQKLIPIEYSKQRILTTEQLAEIYETDINNIHMNFGNNRGRFKEGEHFYFLKGDMLKLFKDSLPNEVGEPLKFVSQLYLWTERGASRHCKILDTNKAWEQFDILEENYFRKQELIQLQPPYDTTKAFSPSEVANLIKVLASTMNKQGSSGNKIAKQVQLTCNQFGIKILSDFVEPSPYEQLSLSVVNN